MFEWFKNFIKCWNDYGWSLFTRCKCGYEQHGYTQRKGYIGYEFCPNCSVRRNETKFFLERVIKGIREEKTTNPFDLGKQILKDTINSKSNFAERVSKKE